VKRPLRSMGQGRPSPFAITPLARHTLSNGSSSSRSEQQQRHQEF
jgi:hypothetical protein